MHSGDQGRHGKAGADGPPALRRRRLRQNGGRAARGHEVHSRRQAMRDPRAHHGARPPALPDRNAPLFRLPGRDRAPFPVLYARPEKGHSQKDARGQRRSSDRHAQSAAKERRLPGSRPSHRGRGAALRRVAQGKAQGNVEGRRCADALGHADPAHTQHGALRPAQHVHHRGAAARPPARTDVRDGAGRKGRVRRHPARAYPRRAGVLSP